MRTASRIRSVSSCLAVLALLALGGASSASAHRVTVFAWVEGDTIHTLSQFSRASKVHDGLIEVFDAATGERLLSGTTNDQGEFSFHIPAAARARGSDLRVALKAGEGHAGEWTVPAAEYAAQTAPTQSGPAKPSAPATTGGSGAPNAQDTALHADGPSAAAQSGQAAAPALADGPVLFADSAAPSQAPDAQVLEQLVERAVERALDRRLAPVTRMLAEQAQAGPSFTEILGGMGWLVGLAGIGAWLSARKKK